MTDNLDERLAEIEQRITQALHSPSSPLLYELIEVDVPWLLARLRDALAENQRLRADVARQERRADAVETIESRARGLAQERADAAGAKLAAVRKACADQRSWCSDERVDVPSWVATIEAAAGSDAEAVTDR